MSEVKKDYFPALTGLRAVAVFLVLIHHFNPFTPERVGWRLHNLTAETHIGVTVFFVLSGFLIGYRYLGQQLSLRTYFANRFARIYPMYFLLTTLTFALLHGDSPESNATQLAQYLLNITFLKGLFGEYVYTGIAQGWSLTVEEMFYVSAPLAFWLISRSWQWLWRLPLLLTAVGVGLVLLSRGQPWHGFLNRSISCFSSRIWAGRWSSLRASRWRGGCGGLPLRTLRQTTSRMWGWRAFWLAWVG